MSFKVLTSALLYSVATAVAIKANEPEKTLDEINHEIDELAAHNMSGSAMKHILIDACHDASPDAVDHSQDSKDAINEAVKAFKLSEADAAEIHAECEAAAAGAPALAQTRTKGFWSNLGRSLDSVHCYFFYC